MADDLSASAPEEQPTVLLVDDEDTFRQATARQLTLRGYRVLDVDNGRDAIKIVRHENPEVVVLDLKMPGMDGLQTLREIKKIRAEVQVVMLTGFGSTETARQSGKHDVFRYLQKPAPSTSWSRPWTLPARSACTPWPGTRSRPCPRGGRGRGWWAFTTRARGSSCWPPCCSRPSC